MEYAIVGVGTATMKNLEVARLFDLMADILEIRDENPFRIRAYRRAAQNLQSLTEDLEALARADRLEEIPGVGEDLAGKIAEYLATGRIKEIEAAKKGIPDGVVELMNVPGVGPKTASRLYRKGIDSLAQLEKRAKAGKLRGLPGIQAKTEESILHGIELMKRGQERMSLGKALPIGRSVVQALQTLAGVKSISLAGSIRRGKTTVGDIDVLAISEHPGPVMDTFAGLPDVAEVLEKGATKASVRHREGIQIDLRVVEPEAFGAALVYFTGSKQHNIRIREMALKRKLKISEYGVFREASGRRVAAATEEEVYAAVGLPWIPPELREDSGEIEAALAGRLPELVRLSDIKGDLHCHTRASDGHHTVEALVAAARARGYDYVAVSDHSPSARVAGGLSADELRAQVKKIRALQRKNPTITILAASECDIRPDGTLDYPDDLLAELDLVVTAIHSNFKQSKVEMTRRICAALANPYVNILAHPTGRLLGERDPYAVDLERIFKAARRHGKAVEINAYPDRLDLDDVHARRAGELGVLVAVNTDTHVLDHLANVELGVATARRGWLEAPSVVNTWPIAKLLAWARPGRGRAADPS